MSSIGTGVAAGVAQSAHAAQQTARERDKKRTENENAARRMRDIVETHLQAVEEGDETDTPTQLHVDNQSVEHKVLPPEASNSGNNGDTVDAVAERPAADAADTPDDDQPRPHLDITA